MQSVPQEWINYEFPQWTDTRAKRIKGIVLDFTLDSTELKAGAETCEEAADIRKFYQAGTTVQMPARTGAV